MTKTQFQYFTCLFYAVIFLLISVIATTMKSVGLSLTMFTIYFSLSVLMQLLAVGYGKEIKAAFNKEECAKVQDLVGKRFINGVMVEEESEPVTKK